ncbi:hypothetical protein PIB30_084724 [Stylosanthes scabra]|uniref:Uncharacterized protein n=1 Tax=Stylosanthes scabra TaxID=79078 RepID=A0ABU6RST4_9FABA|nr:hypothetical protein [Stylosanthes scabra]
MCTLPSFQNLTNPHLASSKHGCNAVMTPLGPPHRITPYSLGHNVPTPSQAQYPPTLDLALAKSTTKNEEKKLAEQETKFGSKTEEKLHAYAWKSTHMHATQGLFHA